MSLFENLPKEVKREEFDEFLENIKDDFPASLFPEIFIHYTKSYKEYDICVITAANEHQARGYQVQLKWRKDRGG